MISSSTIISILARYAIDLSAAHVESLGSAGGLSGALFWRISSPTRELILRRWPVEHPTPERLRFIHAVLRNAWENGITIVPIPLTTHDAESFVALDGHLWELAPWMPGVADFQRAPRIEKLHAAMRALARLHLAVADFEWPHVESMLPTNAAPDKNYASPAIMRRVLRLRNPHPHGAAGLARAITDSIWPELAPLARDFAAALPNASLRALELLEPLSRVSLPLQPCLRDVWHDHILFTGDEVTGIVDFGAVDVDAPAGDVVRLLGSLVGDDLDRWRSGSDAYEAVRPLTADERAALPGLDASGTIIALSNWVRWIYVERRQFENHAQIVARFAALQQRMRKA